MALTPSDIDFENRTLSINKNYQRVNGQDIITTPKTPKSNRIITIPSLLCECLKEYMSHCYDLQTSDRLFPCTKHYLWHEMERGCKVSGVKKIRVHDIRHSHASLLIEMGYDIFVISERLGHENVSTTMDVYGHLYPDKQKGLAIDLAKLKK